VTARGRGTALYFVIAIAICTLALLAPALAALGVLAGSPEKYMAAAPLAVFSPTIAAVIACWREGRGPAVRALFRGLGAYRVHPIWYVIALTLPAVTFVAGRALYGLVPGNEGGPFFYPLVDAQHAVAAVLVPVAEEIGWRGYAQPRLQARHGAVRATWIIGLLWGVWHVPMLLATGVTPHEFFLYVFPMFPAGAFMFTWLYNRTGGSLLLAVLLHAGAHLHNPHRVLPADHVPAGIYTAALVVLALVLVLADRRAFAPPAPRGA